MIKLRPKPFLGNAVKRNGEYAKEIPMKIYEVIYYRNDGDLIYLVRAPDHLSAINEVVANASRSNHGGKPVPKADMVYEIGANATLLPEAETAYPRILRGPYVEPAYNHGWKRWDRVVKGVEKIDEWELVQ